MPRRTDHDEQRRRLARTAATVVATGGLDALTFRELAARAGVSVALVQHYFGTKAELLRHTLDHVSEQVGGRIAVQLAQLGSDGPPGARLLALGEALLPTDDQARAAMVVYLSFAAGALTDESLREGAAFARGEDLRAYVATELAGAESTAERADGGQPVDLVEQATTIVSLLLGLSLVALLPGGEKGDVLANYRRHLISLRLLPG